MSGTDLTAASAQRRLSIPVMLAFGTGNIGHSAIHFGIYSLLLFFYQQVVGLSGTMTGIALGISVAFDAVSDPIVGGYSDRLKGRFGRRHPMIAISILPVAIFFIALFNPPEGLSELAKFIWLVVFAALVRMALTLYSIPHLALGAEMAGDYHQRSTLFTFSTIIGGIGGTLSGIGVYWLIFPTTAEFDPGLLNPDGYSVFAWSAAGILTVSLLICVFGTAREIPHLRKPQVTSQLSPSAVLADMRDVFRDRDFVAIFAGFLLWYLFSFVEAAGAPYMGLHFWGLKTEQLVYTSIVGLLALPLSFLLVPFITRKFDKRTTLIGAALGYIILPNVLICQRLLDVPWYPENGSPWVLINYLIVAFINVCNATIITATYSSMCADVADAHELRTGKRREGAIYSTQAFAGKAAGAVGLIIGGAVLDFIEFPTNALQGAVPADVIWSLGLFVGPATSIFSVLGVLLFLRYQIDKTRHQQIIRELEARRRLDDSPENAAIRNAVGL